MLFVLTAVLFVSKPYFSINSCFASGREAGQKKSTTFLAGQRANKLDGWLAAFY